MKIWMTALGAAAAMLGLTACAAGGNGGKAHHEQAASVAVSEGGTPHKVLIAYFSRSGHTKEAAEAIRDKTDGDLFEIVPEEPYPKSYQATVDRFQAERDGNVMPPFRGGVDMASYDTVFLGYPNWGSDMAPMAKSFLARYDLSGKTVIPFSTHGGGGWGRSLDTLKELAPGAAILEGFETSHISSDKERLSTWLEELGF